MGVIDKTLTSVGAAKKVDVKTQMFINDNDNSINFRPLEIDMSHMVDDADGKQGSAFLHQYKNEYYFPGFQSIPAGQVTPGYPRDTVLQLHDIYTDDELPATKEGDFTKGPVHRIAKNKCQQIDAEVIVGGVSNKIVNWFIVVIVIEVLILGWKVLT